MLYIADIKLIGYNRNMICFVQDFFMEGRTKNKNCFLILNINNKGHYCQFLFVFKSHNNIS